MLERINLKQLEIFILVAFIAVTGMITAYYIIIIQQGSQYTKDEYACSEEFKVGTYSGQIQSQLEAQQTIADYLQQHDITVSRDSLQTLTVEGTYQVRIPEPLYNDRRCTFRKAGTEPPACIGKWFTLRDQTILMEYGSPCNS